jgi:hypothetical protein
MSNHNLFPIWESHVPDALCPCPRRILPRRLLPRILEAQYEDDDDDDLLIATVTVAACLIGFLEVNESIVRRRRSRRLYLTWPELLPNPRVGTPWQILWAS